MRRSLLASLSIAVPDKVSSQGGSLAAGLLTADQPAAIAVTNSFGVAENDPPIFAATRR